MSANDFEELVLAQAQRFFAENVFAALERRHDLGGMKVVASSDCDRIYVGIVKEIGFASFFSPCA